MTSNRSLAGPDGKPHRDDDQATVRPSSTTRRPRSDLFDGLAADQDGVLQGGLESPALIPSEDWRYLVFPDPVAFRYLEEEAEVRIVDRRRILHGYELYVVEQWVCSRTSPTLVIATYTGDASHVISVGVLAVPVDELMWPMRLRIYLRAAQQHHARPKKTKLGELLVTNLSSFPSALTVISVPDGDFRKYRYLFTVNEDLRRLGCSGRSAMTLTEPTEATQVKFYHLYRTSDRIPLLQSVTELVKLCQVALYLFEKLEPEYIDGLLCDVTESAIGDWWTEVGAEHYNFEPTDGILGPSTVAALLGLLMGARNRLHWYGAPVSKDVFDMDHTKRGVAYFQKQQKLEKTRRLDRQTLFKLHTVTAKAAAGEGWGVQKAVKSTVTEIGGKRGEIVMDMVSGKDKGGLADIETLDINRFASLVYGERPKWLWHGKPRRTAAELVDDDEELGAIILAKHEAAGSQNVKQRPQTMVLDDESDAKRREEAWLAMAPAHPPGASDASRRSVFKSVAGKGLGRIKDAVGGGRRGHANRPSASLKDDFADGGMSLASPGFAVGSGQPPIGGRPHGGWRRSDLGASPGPSELESRAAGKKPAYPRPTRLDLASAEFGRPQSLLWARPDDNDLQGPLLYAKRGRQPTTILRRHSCGITDIVPRSTVNENRWARRLSFGDAEQAVLTWTDLVDSVDEMDDLGCLEAHAAEMEHLDGLVQGIVHDMEPWIEDKIKAVRTLNERYARDSDELEGLHSKLQEACRRMRVDSDEILAAERRSLGDGVRELELLFARLEYEIDGLAQKADDLDEGIQTLERHVDGVEERAKEVKAQLEQESWLHWFVRSVTGVGTGANITRADGS
ncbi:Sin3 complex subunit [Ophiocordyceps camponoti-floridani]|uniref:Sin3 complex subunit n=1 Tax=Ophiocordyceps camponoti-floridani TaxID=2030778 RepID=A0A8H4QAI3_9HYPO|nr:Sin3 complex subunit [Ophiocordyceps camponoti-floridani]